MRKEGFTIVEMLVAVVLLGLVTAAFANFFVGTVRTTGTLNARNELTTEGQIAHQIISSRLQEGWWVFPNGSNITLSSSNAWQVTRPSSIGGGTTWTVGGNFVAVVLPPQSASAACATSTQGCYRFFAYYPLLRSAYTTNVTGANRLPSDASNASQWVLMEYRGILPNGRIAANTLPPQTALTTAEITTMLTGLTNIEVNLVADYITPGSTLFTTTQTRVASVTFRPVGAVADTTVNTPIQSINLDLRFSRTSSGRTFTAGGTNTPLNSVIVGRNQTVPAP